LGQNLRDPPNVKGWSGSTAWISSETLLSRWEMTDTLLSGKIGQGQDLGSMMGGPADAKDAAKDAKTTPGADTKPGTEAKAGAEAKKDARKEDSKPVLPLVAKPWIAEARTAGATGIDLATSVLLPLPPIDESPKDFDQALHQILHDPSFNLK
jgi:hypothetical protein